MLFVCFFFFFFFFGFESRQFEMRIIIIDNSAHCENVITKIISKYCTSFLYKLLLI